MIKRLAMCHIDCGVDCRVAPTVLFLLPDNKEGAENVHIGDRVTIRDYTILYAGCWISEDCTVDHHCTIRESAWIGPRTRIMNYAEVGVGVKIGQECRIAGYLGNGATVGDRTSCFGMLVHRYPCHGAGIIEPAPVIGDDVIVGRHAIIAGGVHISNGSRVRAGSCVS